MLNTVLLCIYIRFFHNFFSTCENTQSYSRELRKSLSPNTMLSNITTLLVKGIYKRQLTLRGKSHRLNLNQCLCYANITTSQIMQPSANKFSTCTMRILNCLKLCMAQLCLIITAVTLLPSGSVAIFGRILTVSPVGKTDHPKPNARVDMAISMLRADSGSRVR